MIISTTVARSLNLLWSIAFSILASVLLRCFLGFSEEVPVLVVDPFLEDFEGDALGV